MLSTDPSQLAEVSGEPDSPSFGSIYECFQRGLTKNPDGLAIISAWQAADLLDDTISSKNVHESDDLQWTYRQLNEASLKLATYLAKSHPPGRQLRVASFVWNSIEQAIIYWAVAHLRGIYIPLDPDLVNHGREESRDFFLSTVKPDVVIPLEYTESFERSIAVHFPDAVRISATSVSSLPSQWSSLAAVLTNTTVSDPLGTIKHDAPADPHAPVQILFTSGTTSKPKPIAHTAAQMTVDTIKVASSFPPGTTTALTTANFRPIHLHVVTVMYTAGLTTIIPDPLFNPQAFISTALKHRPLFAGFVPAQLRLILTLAGQQNLTFPSFRSVSAGGDVITADILHTARSLFPNAMLRTGLGMTETYTLAFAKYDLGAPIAALSNGVVSLGAPNAGIVLRVTAHETFHPVKRGETGDLWVAGQTVLEGYLDGRDAESFRAARDLAGRERRWFRTGDWALIDEKGELYVLGRYKDIVVRGGVNLSPVAVETALGKLGLEDAQVVGVPHGIHGSVPVAVVADLRGKDKGKVVESVVGMLGAEYRLEGVWTLEEVGLKEWVYNSTGKISKTDLQKVLRETVLRETGSRESVL